ncbi:zinc-dependent alcohol dehydrogenase family protein [Nocardia arizonensis]|uniref:zinc-dependent alcohol dehydrogenase family protein n=1 Tax=Nocardia arizonensis TaxID=1141647 RepID=UPI0006CF508D|nr:zinc-dependent alcohol dehydrogenase family protein [Nocardia arizonensis]
MRAAVLEAFGSPPVPQTVKRPILGPDRVLVKVAASGVNPLDIKISDGAAAHAQVSVPAILGIDVAGVVVDVAPGVRGFAAGDEVYGMTGGIGAEPGSLAEYVAADPVLLAHKPRRLTMHEAAALPLVAITAWEALVDRADVAAGDLVLVHGGAGGVGHVAVQLAIARGATVYATGSGGSLQIIRSLGATPIDYTTTTVEQYVRTATGGAGFDIVLDTTGGDTLDASFAAVRRYTGRVVSILGWGSHSLAPLSFRGASYSGVFTLLPLLTGEGRAHHGEILTAVAELVDQGSITPIVDPTSYTLAEVAQAHRSVAEGTRTGKVVITVPK